MKKYQYIATLLWLFVALFAIFFSYRLGLVGNEVTGSYSPGPGLMPFVVAVCLLLVSFHLLLVQIYKEKVGRKIEKSAALSPDRSSYIRMILVLVCLFGYAFALEPLGYIIATAVVLFILFYSMGTKLSSSIFASLSMTIATYLIFTHLGLVFPYGIINLQGVF